MGCVGPEYGLELLLSGSLASTDVPQLKIGPRLKPRKYKPKIDIGVPWDIQFQVLTL